MSEDEVLAKAYADWYIMTPEEVENLESRGNHDPTSSTGASLLITRLVRALEERRK